MNGEKRCACKGQRSCLMCENENEQLFVNQINDTTELRKTYTYCIQCKEAWERSDVTYHPNHSGNALKFPGIHIVEDFITEAEELSLANEIDKATFVDSQSGRRKQDYGPKVNFKKQKLNCKPFTGLPPYFKIFYERMKKLDILKDFKPVELCNLEYVPERGSAIDPHFDDFWLWGDRLVTLNLLSDTHLNFTCSSSDLEVCVPLIKRSLIVVCGPARTEWKHAIKRQDILDRRLAVTCRELSSLFLKGGEKEELGESLTELALSFNGIPVGSQ